jgi:acetylglutamate kinase
MLSAIHASVGTFGNILVVMNSSDTDEKNYQHIQDLFPVDSDGNVRFFTSLSAAYDAAESNNNDVIILDGNSSHELLEQLTISKNRVHFV